MSKRRPSVAGPAAPGDGASPPAGALRYWARRLFRPSYTRAGRLVRLRRWAVKLQHQGRRHTFSLGPRPRAGAAREAWALHATLVGLGWDAALARRAPGAPVAVPGNPAAARDSAGYWKGRLIGRPYVRDLWPEVTGGLSARIEHDGESHYFPLGTASRARAARTAAEIHATVVTAGWPRARRTYPREVTVAVFWAMDPLACTYTTLVTDPAGRLGRRDGPGPAAAAGRTCVVVEADAGVRDALAACLGSQAEPWLVRTLATARETLRAAPRLDGALVLLSRSLPDLAGAECAARLAARRPHLPVLTYGVYADSDQLFLSFSGVGAGYVLRRRPPPRLLEPLGPADGPRALTAGETAARVRRYFQGFFGAPPEATPPLMARLTPREQEILEHLSRGYVDKEIAQRLGISAWTVHGHLRSLFRKLQVHTRTEAVVRYLQK
jgi:DNA-binding NarL/FixJ family response regulator